MSTPMTELPESVKKWIEARKPRFCGECDHFKNECFEGWGWCEVLNLGPRCDTPACDAFFKPTEPRA